MPNKGSHFQNYNTYGLVVGIVTSMLGVASLILASGRKLYKSFVSCPVAIVQTLLCVQPDWAVW